MKRMDDDASFTSFPEDRFNERADPKAFSNFYTKMKSIRNAASSAMSTVLPGRGDGDDDDYYYNSSGDELNQGPEPALSQSPFTGARLQALGQSPDSPLKYLHDDTASSHKASPSLAGVTWTGGGGTNDTYSTTTDLMHNNEPSSSLGLNNDTNSTMTMDNNSALLTEPKPIPQLSRSASINTTHSYNIRDHLPGYAMERDPSSDSESITSTRDYIIANIDPRMTRSGGLGKEFWMKDENATECFKCSKPFTTWRRKHHCRLCGQIFCSSCTELINGEKFNYPGRMRACVNCLEVIDKYTSSAESSMELLNQPVAHDTTNPIEISFNSAPQPAPMMAIPATRKGEALEIFPSIDTGSPKSQLLSNMNSHNNPEDDNVAVIDTDDEDGSSEEEDEQAMSLFESLQVLDGKSDGVRTFRPRSGTARSGDGRLIRVGVSGSSSGQRKESFNNSNNFNKLMSSRSKSGLRDIANSSATTAATRKSVRSSNVVSAPSVDLNKASIHHSKAFLLQLLENYELEQKWSDVLLEPLLQCAQNIDLDIRGGDNIDIRYSVKIKRIPGGSFRDITYVDGVVFSKSLALKTMPRRIANPRVLLVTFPIEYSRTGQHFMSLDPVMAQETEYLKKLVRRIVALDPHVVLAGERVSGFAIQLLSKAGIAVVQSVKETVITRVARYTQADIISSIDKLAMNPKLGKCRIFESKSFRLGPDAYKTYLFFRGIPQELGCTILLRGGGMDMLANVKAVAEFMVYVVFSLKLETSLMRDQFVLVPSPDAAASSTKAKTRSIKNSDSRDSVLHHDETGYFHDLIGQQVGKILSSSPFVKFKMPYLLQEARELEDQLVLMERDISALDFEDESLIQKSFDKLGLQLDIDTLPGESVTARELIKAVNGERLQRLREQWDIQKRQWELSYSQAPYMFSASSHQNTVALYSIVNTETTTPCVGPDVQTIDFYSDNDVTLGQYIEQACFTSDDPCPDGCGRPMNGHYRSYVNGTGRINVVVEKFECRLPGLQNTILMWSFCKQCHNTMPVMPMSGTTWNYSFGKYLELSFWSTKISFRAGMCSHDIYRDHVRYFGFHDLAVRFEYDTIDLLEVLVPRPSVTWNPELEVENKMELYKSIKSKVIRFYSSVLSRLDSVIVENVASDRLEECREKTESLKSHCEREQSEVNQSLKRIYLETDINETLPLNGVMRTLQDSVVRWDAEFAEYESNYFPSEKDITRITAQQLKKILSDDPEDKSATTTQATTPADEEPEPEPKVELPSDAENARAATDVVSSENVTNEKDNMISSTSSLPVEKTESIEERDKFKELPQLKPNLMDEPSSRTPHTGATTTVSEPVSRVASPKKEITMSPKIREATHKFENETASDQLQQLPPPHQQQQPPPPSPQFQTRRHNSSSSTVNSGGSNPAPSSAASAAAAAAAAAAASKSSIPTLVRRSDNRSHSKSTPERPSFRKKFSDKIQHPAHTLRQRFGSSTRELERQLLNQNDKEGTKVSSLAKHFDQLSKEFEKERQRERSLMAQGRVRAFPVARAKPIVEVFKNVQDAVVDGNPKVAESRKSTEVQGGPGTVTSVSNSNANNSSNNTNPSTVSSTAATPSAVTPTATTPKEEKKEDKRELETPSSSELSLVDNKDELGHTVEKTSLMQTLTRFWADRSSTGWNPLAYPLNHTEHVFAESDIIVREDEPSSLIAFCLCSADYLEKINSTGQDETLENIMLKKTGMHLKYQFQEGSAMLSCKIFYAEQFEAFRKQCNCDGNFIQSLARCVKWDSSGGKSGSAFLKTLDDRLVVKELSPSELEAFLKFAPSYFEYMAQAFFHDLPTVLAKIFGFYQIQIRNPISGRTIKMDLIVMENLFYNRKMTRIFDLKGSMRNRHVQQTGRENEVLLDENMVEYIYESPLFVREYAKRLLRTSLFNDTLFLAKMNVMDYSLVIGIDEERKQLVVGIIDFIRTFTWDKKLESWVKERGLVGGGVKEPTVVSPRQYKNRFREAMERYVLMVPDCWYQEN